MTTIKVLSDDGSEWSVVINCPHEEVVASVKRCASRIKPRDTIDPDVIYNIWAEWYLDKFNIAPSFSVTDKKAAKEIAAYLMNVTNNDKDRAISGWRVILGNFMYWDKFRQKNVKLTQINHNLNNILVDVKSKQPTSKEGDAARILRYGLAQD